MDEFVLYLYCFDPKYDQAAHYVDIFTTSENNAGFWRPSECCLMIPPIGWDVE